MKQMRGYHFDTTFVVAANAVAGCQLSGSEKFMQTVQAFVTYLRMLEDQLSSYTEKQ